MRKVIAAVAALAMAVLCACSTSTQPRKVTPSYKSAVLAHLTTLNRDTRHIGHAALAVDVPGVHQACAQLQQDTAAITSGPAAPDSRLRALMARVAHESAAATRDCQRADFHSSSQELLQLEHAMLAAVHRIHALR